MKLARLLILIGLLAVSASAVTTATIQFTGFPSGSNVLFTGKINGASIATSLLCDDIAHGTPNNTTTVYTYDVTFGTDSLPWPYVRWNLDASAFAGHSHDGTDTYQVRYRAAAILLAELLGQLAPPAGTYAGSDYQAAVWDLFYTGVSVTGSAPPWNSTIQTLQTDALSKAGNTSFARVYNQLIIYTPDTFWVKANGTNPQEFLALDPVPEPSQAVALLAALGIGWLVRRRKQA